jgi:hypothetical protein
MFRATYSDAVGSYLVMLGYISGLAVFMVIHRPLAGAVIEEDPIYVNDEIGLSMSW